MNKVYGVILAGGSGERLWPLSTPERPKQFVTLFGGTSLIAQSYARLRGLVSRENALVVTAQSLVRETSRNLPDLPKANILGEPCRRNTAAAIALATREAIRRGGEDAVVCVVTADHLIEPVAAFVKTLREAVRLAAREEVVVTIGIRPTYPATGFGYIDAASTPPKFVEKPAARRAKAFLRKGTYLWNSGMFVFRARTMAAALRAYVPETARLLTARDWKRCYASLESISIDYAVMERLRNLKVVAGCFRWDDVGSWSEVPNQFAHDGEGNVRVGKTALYDAKDCLVVSTDDHLCAAIGLNDVVVVHTDRITLVCAKNKSQDVKKLLAELKREGGVR